MSKNETPYQIVKRVLWQEAQRLQIESAVTGHRQSADVEIPKMATKIVQSLGLEENRELAEFAILFALEELSKWPGLPGIQFEVQLPDSDKVIALEEKQVEHIFEALRLHANDVWPSAAKALEHYYSIERHEQEMFKAGFRAAKANPDDDPSLVYWHHKYPEEDDE